MKRASILLLFVAWIFVSCDEKNPAVLYEIQSSSMSEIQLKNFSQSLRRLDQILQDNAPALFAKFAEGASDEDIKILRESLEGAQVESLEMWFRWHNGSTERFLGLVPLGEVMSIQQSAAMRSSLRSGLRGKSVMIMEDGAGDGFFLDITSEEPQIFYEMAEDPYPTYYGTLPQFVEYISDGFSSGVFSVDSEGWFSYDEDRFEGFEETHLARFNKG